MNRKEPPSLGEAYLRILADPDSRVGPSVELPEPPLTEAEAAAEKKFMARVVGYARRRGWEPYHTHDSRRSNDGFPDLVLLRPMTPLVAELKVRPNTPSDRQAFWLNLFRACGIPAYLWYPEDWPAILEVLR